MTATTPIVLPLKDQFDLVLPFEDNVLIQRHSHGYHPSSKSILLN